MFSDEEFWAEIDKIRDLTLQEQTAWFEKNKDKLTYDQADILGAGAALQNGQLQGAAVKLSADLYSQARTQQQSSSVYDTASQSVRSQGGSDFEADRAGRAAVEQAGGDPSMVDTPDFLLSPRVAQVIGWNTADQEEHDRAFDRLQELFPDVESFDDAVDKGYLLDPTTRAVLSNARTPDEEQAKPSFAFENLQGGTSVIYDWEAAQATSQFGLTTGQLIRAAKDADAYGVRTAAGEIAWQPFLAIITAQGGGGDKIQDQDLLPGQRDDINKRRDEVRARIRRYQDMNRRGNLDAKIAEAQQELKDLNTEWRKANYSQNGHIEMRAAQVWREGMSTYGDETLAFFHALDPALASRMNGNKELTAEDARLALSLMSKGGLTGDNPADFISNMAQLGFLDPAFKSAMEGWANYLNMTGGGGGGRQVLKPDQDAIRQSAKDLYRSMYLEDPTDSQLAAMTSQISAAITGAPDDVSVSGEAQVRKVVEGQDTYQKYYGNKPSGMSEEEYQNMHRAAQGSMLGAELADNQAVRIGMREGKYQTTVGAAMGTKEAWDNSTFMGRLANAAKTVAANT